MTQEATTAGTEATDTTEGAATSNPAEATATAADTQGQAATTEATTAEVKTEEKPQGAPEAYEFKAAEGKSFDPKVLEAYSEVAKELNLSQENAQKVIDKIAPELASQQERVMAEARTQWTAQVKADTEIGGANVAENIALANKAFQDFGTPELRKLLETTGIGDHPEMIRWAHRVGKAISEDGFVAGKGSNVPAKDARSLYSSSNMNP